MGFNSSVPDVPVTPERRSRARFDVPDLILTEPAFGMERVMDELCRSNGSIKRNVHFIPAVGWQLEPFNVYAHKLHESNELNAKVLNPTNANATAPSGFFAIEIFREPTDITGVTTGKGDNIPATGDSFLQKQAAANSDWSSGNFVLASDQGSFPGPAPITNITSGERNDLGAQKNTFAMDRVLKGTSNLSSSTPITVRFIVPGGKGHVPDEVKRIYFNGPAGIDSANISEQRNLSYPIYGKGNGQYCLVLYGSGRAWLWEKDADASPAKWIRRDVFVWAMAPNIIGVHHTLHIRPSPLVNRDSGPGGSIYFWLESAGESQSRRNSILSYTVSKQEPRSRIYRVPRRQGTATPAAPAVSNAPARIDSRRDNRTAFQVSLWKYPKIGNLRDDVFSTDFPAFDEDTYFRLFWFGTTPSGTSLKGRLYDANALELGTPIELELVSEGANYKVYKRPTDPTVQRFYAEFEWQSSTGDDTATLTGYRVVRDAVAQDNAPGEFVVGAGVVFERQAITEVFDNLSITGPESDPSHETASFRIRDLTDDHPRLNIRGDLPLIIDTEYPGVDWSNPANEGLQSRLFQGYANRLVGSRRGHAGIAYPDPLWRDYQVSASGMWQRLSEAISSIRFNWYDEDPEAAANPDGTRPPYKATTAIKSMIGWAGFPDSMIDVPDLSIRLFAGKDARDLYIEPYANISEYIIRIARDYLGYFLIFDANAGDRGMWRLKAPTIPPYKNLAEFLTAGAGPGKVQHSLNSYPSSTVSGQLIQGAFIQRGSLRTWVKRPEGNKVTVSGTGSIDGDAATKMTQTLCNPQSYNFAGLDSGHPNYPDALHPDYIGRCVPIVIVDPGLTTPEAVTFVLRRVYDVACHGIRLMSFTAPLLLVTESADTLQDRPRPLRFYDPILVNGEQFLVRNVNPIINKDHIQMAIYEVEAPREPYI